MKCTKCGQEMRFGQEQYATNVKGEPMYKDFAYCDNCRIKVEIQQTSPNNGFQNAGIQNTNNIPKKKHGCLWCIIVFFLVCAVLSQCGISDDDSSKNKKTSDTSVSSTVTATPKSKKAPKKSKSATKQKDKQKSTSSPKKRKTTKKKTDKIKKSKFINACKKYNYKKVMRKPDKYIGKKIKLKCQINQISEDGLFTQGFLRCYSYSGYDVYADNEYVVFDKRSSKSPKLLTDDIITVYGTIEKPEKMTRALTGTEDTVFTINMKYVKIHNQ